MQEARVQCLGQEDPLDKEMASHSNVLARRIPWTEEPGKLQSTGSQNTEHSLAAEQSAVLLTREEEFPSPQRLTYTGVRTVRFCLSCSGYKTNWTRAFEIARKREARILGL